MMGYIPDDISLWNDLLLSLQSGFENILKRRDFLSLLVKMLSLSCVYDF